MITYPKATVLQHINQSEPSPKARPRFTTALEGHKCQLTVKVNQTVYRGTGRADCRKEAEEIAYGDILRQMLADHLEVVGAIDALDNVALIIAKQAHLVLQKAIKILEATLLTTDTDNITCLSRFATSARLPPVTYVSDMVYDPVRRWATRASIQFPLATLTSDTHCCNGKKGSQKMAAGDLIARIRQHVQLVAEGAYVPGAAGALDAVGTRVTVTAEVAASEPLEAKIGRLRKAIPILREQPGGNAVLRLRHFARATGIPEPVYTSVLADSDSQPPVWDTRVEIELPTATLSSDVFTGSNQEQNRKNAAGDLIGHIKAHLQQ